MSTRQILTTIVPLATVVMVYFIWKNTKPAHNGQSQTGNGAGEMVSGDALTASMRR